MSPPRLFFVVPCHNEEAVIPETVRQLQGLLATLAGSQRVAQDSGMLLVDDGSQDRTWDVISAMAAIAHSRVSGIKLSRNRGHQLALLAGLFTAQGDALISLDADLQDDLAAVPKMLDALAAGYDVVYGVRSLRSVDSWFKRRSAEAYYRLLHRLGVEVIFNHADYRLLSRRAVEALRSYPERNVFLRGLIPQIGFPSTIVEYERKPRLAGTTHYPLHRMLSLAWQGITSFSVLPLRVITALGIAVSMLSLLMGMWALWVGLFSDAAVPGWASTIVPLFFLFGVQLLSLGVIGEYVSKVFVETKQRPLYFVEQTTIKPPAVNEVSANSSPT